MSTVRSPQGLAGALVLLAGIAVALAVGMTVGTGAELIVHLTLGATFLLFAAAAFDFRTPGWIAIVAAVAMAAFGALFLLQAAADLAQSPGLTHLAFAVLGQRIEKLLGYAFLLWCLAVWVFDSRGATRILGLAVLAAIVAAEAYGFALGLAGQEAPAVLKLAALPVFVWLALESAQRR